MNEGDHGGGDGQVARQDHAMTLRVYCHVYDDALASAGEALLGRSRSSRGQ